MHKTMASNSSTLSDTFYAGYPDGCSSKSSALYTQSMLRVCLANQHDLLFASRHPKSNFIVMVARREISARIVIGRRG
jgi:hypothetical protein